MHIHMFSICTGSCQNYNMGHFVGGMVIVCSNYLRLEGSPPGVKMAGGVPGFSTPQLPRPGQKVAKKNALKIEK